MQDGRKAVWSIPYVSVAFFPSLKHNFIVYRSSKVFSRPDCIFEIHQLWQSGFSRVYSNCYCSCSFEPEILKIGQSSHKMYSNNIVNFQVSTTILLPVPKKSVNLLKAPRMIKQYIFFCLHIFVSILLKLPYGCYHTQPQLAYKLTIINWFPSTFEPFLGHHQRVCILQKRFKLSMYITTSEESMYSQSLYRFYSLPLSNQS